MEQRFPEFPGKKPTSRGIPIFSGGNFLPGISILFDFPHNFQIFPGISVPFVPVSKFFGSFGLTERAP